MFVLFVLRYREAHKKFSYFVILFFSNLQVENLNNTQHEEKCLKLDWVYSSKQSHFGRVSNFWTYPTPIGI